ncbi:hypothetical protein LOK49_LG03G02335 [Camellia lanceoleosa]|uniref:Uncharacterized protein n=1 Tax=Camellia lanceoleosa TaxID=1840588 RepID=A0ACC0IH29_9ERIC|nr:hypothetical protein LOK49_LG03G02335 [Camellia lanceoleosa]
MPRKLSDRVKLQANTCQQHQEDPLLKKTHRTPPPTPLLLLSHPQDFLLTPAAEAKNQDPLQKPRTKTHSCNTKTHCRKQEPSSSFSHPLRHQDPLPKTRPKFFFHPSNSHPKGSARMKTRQIRIAQT